MHSDRIRLLALKAVAKEFRLSAEEVDKVFETLAEQGLVGKRQTTITTGLVKRSGIARNLNGKKSVN